MSAAFCRLILALTSIPTLSTNATKSKKVNDIMPTRIAAWPERLFTPEKRFSFLGPLRMDIPPDTPLLSVSAPMGHLKSGEFAELISNWPGVKKMVTHPHDKERVRSFEAKAEGVFRGTIVASHSRMGFLRDLSLKLPSLLKPGRARSAAQGVLSGAAVGIVLISSQAAFFASVGHIQAPPRAANPDSLSTAELYGPLTQVLEIPTLSAPLVPLSPYAGFPIQPSVYTGWGMGTALAYDAANRAFSDLPELLRPTVDTSSLYYLPVATGAR